MLGALVAVLLSIMRRGTCPFPTPQWLTYDKYAEETSLLDQDDIRCHSVTLAVRLRMGCECDCVWLSFHSVLPSVGVTVCMWQSLQSVSRWR